jgi:hypothetical protein
LTAAARFSGRAFALVAIGTAFVASRLGITSALAARAIVARIIART